MCPGVSQRHMMDKTSRRHAINSDRTRLPERGMVRFKVIGRAAKEDGILKALLASPLVDSELGLTLRCGGSVRGHRVLNHLPQPGVDDRFMGRHNAGGGQAALVQPRIP